METHALNVFNQHTMPPVRIGPPITPTFDPDTMPPIRRINYTPTGEFHPVAEVAGEIHKIILDLLLRLHWTGTFPLAHNFHQQFGKRNGLNIY